MNRFTQAELARHNGKDGRPAYIAHKGKVYDVSASKLWRGGLHMKRHSAGMDLTTDIQGAPHNIDVLERYPLVGIVADEPQPTRPMPEWIAWMLETNPFFRRHPHPMTVHFPIVFLLSHPVFNLLFLIIGNRAFETTAFHCLGGGVIFMGVAMMTGFFTWWYNYLARMMRPVAVKISLSMVTLGLALALFIWRWNCPEVMLQLKGANWLYLFGSLGLIPLIAVIGWYGAVLTFPMERD